MARVEALITPSVMLWARERSGLSIEEAAIKIGRPVEDIKAWENSSLLPSIAQARKAAKVYKRPLALFYLPEPPKDFETLRDFRSLPDEIPRDYSSELSVLVRTALEHQIWMRDFLIEEKISPLTFVGSASTNDSAEKIALDIIDKLDLSPDEQRSCYSREEALRLWINKTEQAGIFVFRQGQIDLEEARGFIISDEHAPFIYLNSDDAKAAQMFTLAHELSHLWLNQSGISNLEPPRRRRLNDEDKIELLCNKVASEAILNSKSFNSEWQKMDRSRPVEELIEKLSREFKVSEEVIARRLKEKQILSQKQYMNLREKFQIRWREHKTREKIRMKETKGWPSYYTMKIFNNGYSFTNTVVSAFENGAISGREASGLLDIKVNNIPKLAVTAGLITSVRGES